MSPQSPDPSLPENSRAWGHGLATVTDDGLVLDTWYPAPELGNAPDGDAPDELARLAGTDAERLRVVVDQVAVLTDSSALAWHARLR